MSNYLPYTYLIGWSKQDLWYYGCQYGCSAHPSNLWTSYFTSSKTLHQLRATLGEPDVIQVRRTFTTALAALEWESRVLKRMNATFSPRWINKHNGNTQFNVLDSDRWATQKSREDQSTLMSSLWQDPAFREAWSTKQNERWNSTDRVVDAEEKRDRLARESHSSAIKKGYDAFWSDPENKKKHSDKLRERHRKNREKYPILADGRSFKSKHECADFYDRSVKWVRKRIQTGEFQIIPVESDPQ